MSVDSYNQNGGQGGLEAASRTSREMATWNASSLPIDALMQFDKHTIDDRSRDVVMNDGYASGAIAIHKDNIVGNQFRLNSRPDLRGLRIDDETWGEEFQNVVESRFNTAAESPKNWFDASGVNDFTMLIRQAIGHFVLFGEVIATVEWIKDARRPFATAVQFINPRRLCNPYGTADSAKITAGIERDDFGRAIAYHILKAHPYDMKEFEKTSQWVRVAAETRWGRAQVIHVIEQLLSDQTRGISELVSVLKQMRMTRRFQDVELQQAILQATYAATIESDLPAAMIAEAMGSSPNAPSFDDAAYNFLYGIAQHKPSRDLQLDGTRIPVLYPNTKLNLQQLGQPSGVGSAYEQSLLRHIAAGLGISYEQFSRDYTKTNYSSARASMNETYKFMQARKKIVADRTATNIYRAWLEEQIQQGEVPLPKGKTPNWIYENPFILDGLSRCSWIGAPRGQIDEMKETQAAILRVNFGLSTMELEAAKFGLDWRDLLRQRKREQDIVAELGVKLTDGAEKAVVSKKPSKDDAAADDTTTDDEDL